MEGKEEISDTDSGVILHSGRFNMLDIANTVIYVMLYSMWLWAWRVSLPKNYISIIIYAASCFFLLYSSVTGLEAKIV